MIFDSTVFVSKNIDYVQIIHFMKMCKEKKVDVHSFEIIHNGNIIVRIAPAPYSFEYKQQVYSLSKSFTSTAIGFLVDEGKVNIDDRLVDIFSDVIADKVGINAKKMCVKHLLSMNTGHKNCILSCIRNKVNPVKSFLECEPEFEPGTYFCYNNAATFMLSEIVRKYTDMTVFDFLKQRLFKPLGINNAHWNTFANGNSQGAVGLHISTDDIAKLGLLYLNKGVFNGKRLLSENWVNTATRIWSDNSNNGTPDWSCGYGFQFWKNYYEGFRGDGAFGQLCMVFPSKNMIFAMEANTENMQKEIDLIYKLIDNLYGDSNIGLEGLYSYIDEFNKLHKYCNGEIPDSTYKCEKNEFGITFISILEENNCIKLFFSDGVEYQKMVFGKNRFCENRIILKKFKPTLESLAGHNEKELVHFAAHCTFEDDGLHLYFNYLDNPHVDEYVCLFNKSKFEMKRSEKFGFCYNETIRGISVDI